MTDTAETTTETTAIDYSKFGAFAPAFEQMIPQLAEKGTEHDDLVSQLKVKPGEVDTEALEAARLRNKSGNAEVRKLNDTIAKAEARIAELKEQAYESVKGDIPQPLSEEDRPKVQEKVKTLRAEFNKMHEAIETMADTFGLSLDGIELPTIMANARKSGGGGQTGGFRIRTTDVFVDGNRVEAKKPNSDETTSTLSVAASVISKAVKSKVAAADLQKAYFAANGTEDYDSIPADSEFTFNYTSGDLNRDFLIRVVK